MFIIDINAEFQLDASERKVSIFSPSKFMDPLTSIHGPQIKNGCRKRRYTDDDFGMWETFTATVLYLKLPHLEPQMFNYTLFVAYVGACKC